MSDGRPRVHVHDPEGDGLANAVLAAGGVLADLQRAEVVVWDEGRPEELGERLHAGVRLVQLTAAGIENWFEAGVIDDKRLWAAAKGVYDAPIAEYVLAMMLAFARQLPKVVADSEWRHREPKLLAGHTIGIVGAGGIGQATLRSLTPFGVRTLALTRSGRQVPQASVSLGPGGLERLLAESDYVVLAAPATPETDGMISAERLALMRDGACLINVGRGTLVDTDALVAELRDGRISAALDVTDPEPLPSGHPLWTLPNAIVTSHTANTARLGRAAMASRVKENVARFARGEKPLGLVDAAARY
jgi:phosphoglycerate dehydrogenase-like enzyme